MKKHIRWMKHQSKYENIVYIALWGMLYAAPVLSLYVRTVNDSAITFDWQEVLMVWRQISTFLLLFLIHNFLLAPMLVQGHRRVVYFSAVAVILALFVTYQCNRPHRGEFGPRPMERPDGHRPPMSKNEGPERMGKPEGPEPRDEMESPQPMDLHEGPESMSDGEVPAAKDDKRPHRFRPDGNKHDKPPVFVGEHDIIAIVILILMFGANLGIKGYFKSRDDRKRLEALERENLEQQLEYLRYQINPHFFMNTLNNIHALVDIDPEKAKDTILELSRMMRFVLYEGNKQGVPLSREFEFIRHYITLMRLRYTDKVRITVDLPGEAPDRMIPPLMLITFIENAFKHGISYQHPSFIDIKVGIEHERLRFECRNSKAEKPNQEKGGVGLQNVKQRLNLLYDNNFTLNIQDNPDTYIVELNIPLT